MRVAIIGRTETLYETAIQLKELGFEIAVIVTAKESLEYTKTQEDYRSLAESWHVPFFSTSRIETLLDQLRELPLIDVAVSLNYSGVLSQSIIDIFPLGVLNAHGGDLPKYRGNACQAWAIINGEERIGLCVHRMIGGELDSGDIITRDYLPIEIDTKVTEVWDWMGKRIPCLFIEALNKLTDNQNYILEKQSLDPIHHLRCYSRRPEDGLIDWKLSAIDIVRLVNACNKPYSGAYCYFQSQKLTIWDAVLAKPENFLAIPGQVTMVGKDFIEVATGDGKIRINSMELEGNIVVPSEVVRSTRNRLSSVPQI